jgi:CRISPR/Cas system CSM-associated protein Csm3 (group 7 of RAMP superfamily)
MGRLISHRYVLTGDLVAETPVHIGAAFGEATTDLPLARDGADRFYLPGTSLAGPIRRWWRRHWDDAEMFGRIPERDDDDEGFASHLVVDDAPAIGVPVFESRDGVGIDRETGGAAEGFKYDREVLPCGTRFDFRMDIEVPNGQASVKPANSKPPPRPNADETRQRLGALILALERGQIRFGAAKTRGLGRLVLADARVAQQDIGGRAGMLARLKQASEPTKQLRDALVDEAATVSQRVVEIAVTWRPDLPVMNKSDAEGVSVDALPFVSANGDLLRPVITGASVKGVLRSHAERICRTIEPARTNPDKGDGEAEFHRDLSEPELAEAVFGSRGRRAAEEKKYTTVRDDVAIPGLAAFSVDDCVIDKPITRPAWRELLTKVHDKDRQEKTGAVRDVLDESAPAWRDFRPSTHVAIDRWTGGAAESLLFGRLEPTVDGLWTFRMWLDLERIAPTWADRYPKGEETPETADRRREAIAAFRQAGFGLVLVTLRELARGHIPIGYGTTRGLGSIKVERMAVLMPKIIAMELGLADGADQIVIAPGDFEDRERMNRFAPIQKAWRDYWAGKGASQ